MPTPFRYRAFEGASAVVPEKAAFERLASRTGSGGDPTVTAGVAIEDAVVRYLERKATGDPDGSGAGAYASKAESILGRWSRWLAVEHDVAELSAVGVDELRAYAEELRARTDRGEYTASTARTYFAVVRAFLSWCADVGLLADNPAATDRAQAPLPVDSPATGSVDAAADPETAGRRELVGYVRERALEAAETDREERLDRLREYALVSLLAHSDVRGAELFRVPEDDRRNGAVWGDVDFYTGTIRVLGKSQRVEVVPLPAAARTPLRRYRIAQDPPTTDWPLFPTRHAPSIARCVRSGLGARGVDEAEIDALLAESTAESVARERAISPPAITTEGARSILRRLCSDAGLELEAHLTPRGVRSPSATTDRREASSAPSTDLLSPSPERSIARVEAYRRPFERRSTEVLVDE